MDRKRQIKDSPLEKGDVNMTTATLNKIQLSDFIKQNMERVYEAARKNTKYNEQGQAVISKDDPWRDEDVWDEHFKRMDKKE